MADLNKRLTVPVTTEMLTAIKQEAEALGVKTGKLARLFITKAMLHADTEKAAQQMVASGVVANGAPLTIEEARKLARFLTGEFE